MIQWTTPMMLAGLGLLSLPIIAHLLSRRSRVRYVVSTNRFLASAASEQNRLLKLRRWLLLLLRCLIVTLIVLAFARPTWTGTPNVTDAKSRSVAIVIDISASTSQRLGNTFALKQFQAMAERILGELEEGVDQANLILIGNAPIALAPKLTKNFELLRKQLREVAPSFARGDIEAGIDEAVRQLQDQPGRKSLVVISDLQATNWATETGEILSLRIPTGIETQLVDFEPDRSANYSLLDARSTPTQPIANQPFQLSVELASDSASPSQIPVTVKNSEGKSETVLADVPALASTILSFQIAAEDLGNGEFTIEIPADRLELDNRRYFCLSRAAVIPVLLITDDVPDSAGTSVFFMERALSPFADAQDRYRVNVVSSRELNAETLKNYPVAVIAYVNQLPDTACLAIGKFVFEGGTVLQLCGEGEVDQLTRQLDQATDNKLLPFQLGSLERFKKYDEAPHIAGGKWRSRWLAEFDIPSQVALQQIRVPRAWAVTSSAADAEVLLMFSDNRPALALRAYGQGQMFLANFSPSTQFGDLGAYGSFPALIQILLGQMVERSSEPAPIVGKPIRFTPRSLEDAANPENARTKKAGTITGPQGLQQSVSAELLHSAAAHFVDTQAPGFYRFSIGDQVVQSVAVNLDNRECNLTPLPTESIELVNGGQLRIAAAGQVETGIANSGRDLWGWLALVALVSLALESLLLGTWRQ